tara:strand:+ start:955 stop:1227 length:273 start_codon:yes stop_codon:yes gene_type:complete
MVTGRPTIVHAKMNILAVVVVNAILTTMVTTIFAYVTTILMEIVANVAKNTGGEVVANCTATRTVRTWRGQSTVTVMVSVKYKRATMSNQ